MVGGYGLCLHCNLVKLNCNQMQTRRQHLLACKVESITDIGLAQARNSICANLFVQSSQVVISRSQVRYLSSIHGQSKNHHFLNEEFNNADKLVNLLEGQQHIHHSLPSA